MIRPMRASHLFALGLVSAAMAGCTEGERSPGPEASTVSPDAQAASSATVFDLAPDDLAALERRAMSSDAEAAFRLSQFYSLAGGRDGATDADLVGGDDAVQEMRWLEVAAHQGHETAEITLAVRLVQRGRDCERGLRMLTTISRESPSAAKRERASEWLRDDAALKCRGAGSPPS